MAPWAAGKQRLNQRSTREVPVRVVGTVVRRQGRHRLTPLGVEVEVEVPTTGVSVIDVHPVLDQGLGALLSRHLGERLVVTGWMVQAGAVRCLSVHSFWLDRTVSAGEGAHAASAAKARGTDPCCFHALASLWNRTNRTGPS